MDKSSKGLKMIEEAMDTKGGGDLKERLQKGFGLLKEAHEERQKKSEETLKKLQEQFNRDFDNLT